MNKGVSETYEEVFNMVRKQVMNKHNCNMLRQMKLIVWNNFCDQSSTESFSKWAIKMWNDFERLITT